MCRAALSSELNLQACAHLVLSSCCSSRSSQASQPTQPSSHQSPLHSTSCSRPPLLKRHRHIRPFALFLIHNIMPACHLPRAQVVLAREALRIHLGLPSVGGARLLHCFRDEGRQLSVCQLLPSFNPVTANLAAQDSQRKPRCTVGDRFALWAPSGRLPQRSSPPARGTHKS